MKKKSEVLVIGRDFETDIRDGLLEKIFKVKKLKMSSFKNELASFVNDISTSLDEVSTSFEKFELDELVLNLEVSVSGKIALIGSGVSSGAKGGVQIKFKKK